MVVTSLLSKALETSLPRARVMVASSPLHKEAINLLLEATNLTLAATLAAYLHGDRNKKQIRLFHEE